jgi:alpha-glutamyl/putrescinyl thymine pyrophosphorylase clade 1
MVAKSAYVPLVPRTRKPIARTAYLSEAAYMELPIHRLAFWLSERSLIQQKREAGEPKPWTDDPILLKFKFCNVRREDDRVTKWIRDNWREQNSDDPFIWNAMSIARLINWPGTLQDIGYPERGVRQWLGKEQAKRAMHFRQEMGEQVFTGAYMITNGGRKGSKIDFICNTLAENRLINDPPVKGDTLSQAYNKLRAAPGLGSFLAAQVVADCKYTELLKDAEDWYDWAAPGPGSVRGLKRLVFQKVTYQEEFVIQLKYLRKWVRPLLKDHVPDLCLQDIQNCLCEFDKFERTLWGEGRPRSTYPGAA